MAQSCAVFVYKSGEQVVECFADVVYNGFKGVIVDKSGEKYP